MSPSRQALVLLLAAVVLSAQALAGGFQLNEHGAKAMAQAGAFAARASDGSAIFFNPAGLAFQKDASVYLGLTTIIPKTAFYGPLQNNSNNKTSLSTQIFTPINFYGTYPVNDRLAIGLGVNNPYGLGTKWPDNWAGRYLSVKVDLKSFFFTPTVAYRITDDLSVGVGANYVTGDVTIERYVAAGIDDPRVSLDMSGHGWGFNGGLLYKVTPELSVGASYRHSVKIEASGTAAFIPAYSALPAGDVSAAITLPATGFFGVAYKFMPNLEVEADVQWIGWSSYDELVIEFKKNASKSVAPKKYKDTYMVRLGGEYTLDEWHVRGGYFYDHSPVQKEYLEPMLPDANRHGLNIGFGYEVSKSLTIDVSYLFLLFETNKAENTIPEVSFDGTYKSYVHLIGLNFEVTL